MKAWSYIFRSRVARLVLGLLLSGLAIYLALREVELNEVGRVLLRAKALLLFLALISNTSTQAVKAWRWKILLRRAGDRISYYHVFMSSMVGQLLNLLFPARMGELSRVYWIGGMGAGKAYTFGTLFVEKAFDMTCFTVLVLWMLLVVPIPNWMGQSGWTFALLTAGVVTAMLVVLTQPKRIAGWLEKLFDKFPGWPDFAGIYQIREGLSSLEVLRSGRDLLLLTAFSGLLWSLAVTTNMLTLQALEIDLPISASILVLVVLQAGISLPAAPGKVGLFEYACMLALGFYGITQGEALGFGVLLHILVLLPLLISGTVYLWRRGEVGSQPAKTQEPAETGEDPA